MNSILAYLFTYPEFSHLAWKYGVLNRSNSFEEMYEIVKNIFPKESIQHFFKQAEIVKIRTETLEIQTLTYFDSNYPFLLKQIPQPPIVLFYKGNIELINKKMIAVVGTRNPSPISLAACGLLPSFFSKSKDFALISGLAVGIDKEAMLRCLESNLGVVGVMGTGFDKIYPRINNELYKRILEYSNGLILTEMRLGEQVGKWSFPKRNRIITGLAETTIIMEAPLDSGAMSSANHALSQNREILVFDHPEAFNNQGGRKLLSEGASLLTWDDLSEGKKKIIHISELFPKDYSQVTAYLNHLSNLELKGILKNKGGGYYELKVEKDIE